MTYRELADDYKCNPRNVHTVPLDNREPKWFYVFAEDDALYVTKAKEKTPSSHISIPRKLDESEFEDVLNLYGRRKAGEHVSKESTDATRNQVYWYGIFSEWEQNQ